MRMVAISFSVFKDKLLDGSKTQTIRLWKQPLVVMDNSSKITKPLLNARIKVGTPLQIYWKQRQKKVWKCSVCGELMVFPKDEQPDQYDDQISHCDYCYSSDHFDQVSGSEKLFDATCTETFLIKMGKSVGGIYWCNDFNLGDEWLEDLALADGFEDDTRETAINDAYTRFPPATTYQKLNPMLRKTAAEKMFEFIDKHYDLSKPKIFQVIRWGK